MPVTLEPITPDNLSEVVALRVSAAQEAFVASTLYSLAQAYTEYDVAWARAISADGAVVGFLMLEIDPDDEDGQPFWLWRLLIDERHQRRGFGRAAVALACEEVRRRGGTELFTSWVPGNGSPNAFYARLGFEPTGQLDGDEVVARLPL